VVVLKSHDHVYGRFEQGRTDRIYMPLHLRREDIEKAKILQLIDPRDYRSPEVNIDHGGA
jgi:hypothetical protein